MKISKLFTAYGPVMLAAMGLTVACGDDEDTTNMPPPEVITTVNLTFMGASGNVAAQWLDADGDGGNDPVITQPGALTAGETYNLSVELLNETEDPAEDVTEEIREEAEEHLFFYVPTGDVITVAISDMESEYTTNAEGDDLPVGLAATVTASTTPGMGTLNVVLKHLPPVNGTVQKTAATTINDGESDIDVTFNITVQ